MKMEIYIFILMSVAVIILVFLIHKFIKDSEKKEKVVIKEGRIGWAYELFKPIIKLYANHLNGKVSEKKIKSYNVLLMESGLGYKLVPEEIVAMKRLGLCLGIAAAIIVISILDLQKKSIILSVSFMLPLMGYIYADAWIKDQRKIRVSRIEKDFPFFLDLLVLMMRAGLPFAGSINQSVEKLNDGPLKDELIRYQRDIRTGLSRIISLENFDSRINIPAITNFVASIIQSEETGGSITKALTEQAKQRRKERFLKAEKKANEAPVKMLFPLIGLLFPITFIIIGFPIAVEFIDSGLFEKIGK